MIPILPTWTPTSTLDLVSPQLYFCIVVGCYVSIPRGTIIQSGAIRYPTTDRLVHLNEQRTVQYTLDKGHTRNHGSFCYAEAYNQFISHHVQEPSKGTYRNTTTGSVRIHTTWNLPHEWKNDGRQDQRIPLSHHWLLHGTARSLRLPLQVLRAPS